MNNKDNTNTTSPKQENNNKKNNYQNWRVNIPYLLRYGISTLLVLISLQMLTNNKPNDDAIATMLLGTGLTPFGIELMGKTKK